MEKQLYSRNVCVYDGRFPQRSWYVRSDAGMGFLTLPILANLLAAQLLQGRRGEMVAVFARLDHIGWTRFIKNMAQVGFQFSEATQKREALLNHYLTFERRWSEQSAQAYQSFVHTMKILLRKGYSGNRFSIAGAKLSHVPELIYLLAPRELMPHFLYRLVKVVKNKISGGVTELIVVNYCEQAPNPQSRVYLSHERDRLQMNRLVLD